MKKSVKFNYLKFIYDKGLYREFLIYCAYHPGLSKRRVAYWFIVHKGLMNEVKDIVDKAIFIRDPYIQAIAKEKWL